MAWSSGSQCGGNQAVCQSATVVDAVQRVLGNPRREEFHPVHTDALREARPGGSYQRPTGFWCWILVCQRKRVDRGRGVARPRPAQDNEEEDTFELRLGNRLGTAPSCALAAGLGRHAAEAASNCSPGYLAANKSSYGMTNLCDAA